MSVFCAPSRVSGIDECRLRERSEQVYSLGRDLRCRVRDLRVHFSRTCSLARWRIRTYIRYCRRARLSNSLFFNALVGPCVPLVK